MSFILVGAAGFVMGAAFNVYFMTGVNAMVLAAFFLASSEATTAAKLINAAMAVVCLQGGFFAGMMLQLAPLKGGDVPTDETHRTRRISAKRVGE